MAKVPRLAENVGNNVLSKNCVSKVISNISSESDEEGFLGFGEDEIVFIRNELDLKRKCSGKYPRCFSNLYRDELGSSIVLIWPIVANKRVYNILKYILYHITKII